MGRKFQNKGKSGWTGTSSFVLEVPLHNLRPGVIYSVPWTRGRERSGLAMLLSAGSSRTLRSLPLVRVNLLARHSARASKISESRGLTFFDSELCSVRCGGQFGLEFNWKGALNPIQRLCGGIEAVGWISVFFFRFEHGSVQNRVCSLYFFLVEENQKSDNSLKTIRIKLRSDMVI